MKPAPFVYHRPDSIEEALDLLRQYGDEAKILAGGQSLVPMMSLRLVRPDVIIDINELDCLAGVRESTNTIHIGALTRQSHAERDPAIVRRLPLLPAALAFVAHLPIRNRGTVGGSAAHADPSAELPVALMALEASFVLRAHDRERSVNAEEFFISYLTTALNDDEILVGIDVPIPPPRTGASFREFARRSGDYALGGAAALVTTDGHGICTSARIALLGSATTPVRAYRAEQLLIGIQLDEDAARNAAIIAVEDIAPLGNVHGDPAYRRRVVETMCRRAIIGASPPELHGPDEE